MQHLNELVEKAKLAIESIQDKSLTALDEIRVEYFGKKGHFTQLMQELRNVSAEERPAMGAKINEATDKAVDKVESYNKNNLFEKIFFGFSVAITLFSGLVVLNGLGYALKGNALSSVDFYEVSNKVKNLNLYFSLTFFLTIIATVFVAYFLFMANKSKKNLWTNVNVSSLAMVVGVYLAHLLGGGFISLIGTMTDMFNGKVNTSISNLVMQAFTDPNHATKQAMSLVNSFESGSKLAVLFYIVACAAAIVTSYFYYQKLFQKKD